MQPWAETLGDLAAAAAPSMGFELLEWQRRMLLDMGAVGAGGKWVHPRVGGSIPRQQGKSVVLLVWAAFLAAVMGYKVLWSEHNYSTTMEMLDRFRDVFGTAPGDPVRGRPQWKSHLADRCSQTGQEWMRFRSGGVIQFSTRTKTSRLGFSFDVVVYDEAQELTGAHVQVINPTTTSGSKHNLQLLYFGTPTRAGSAAEVFANVRAQAWEDAAPPDLMWVEYGVPEVGDIWDESRWAAVMPSLGAHADPRAVRAGMRDIDELGAAQEYLGYWLPPMECGTPPLLDAGQWAACLVQAAPPPGVGERVAYGVKFSSDGAEVAVACAALAPGSHTPHVELAHCELTSHGTSWLADWLAERAGRACAVAVDGKSGAPSLCEELARRRAPRGYVLRPTADQAVAAASAIYEGVVTQAVTHIDDEALELSVTTSYRRPIGSAGGWGWGGTASAPIEACGLALWALRSSKRNPTRRGGAA